MTDEPDATAPTRTRPRWRRLTDSPWLHLAAAVVVTGLVLSLIAKPYLVPSASMEQTLGPGDRVLVFRPAYLGGGPATGDVIVFDADQSWGPHSDRDDGPLIGLLRWIGEWSGFGPSGEHTLIKRVIAGPGQTAECCTADGRITVDGVPLDEPYVTNDLVFEPGAVDCASSPASLRCFAAVTVPADSYLVLGDNRANSSDSAYLCRTAEEAEGCWRWAHRDGIVGRAVAIVWPVTRWSGL
ncbi:signal peptidase I [Microbacterium sp.]|uniref:signal peptidase I n=1 Tax=Microbacterium sp. TaxID=51671 RepID=UPI0037CBC992